MKSIFNRHQFKPATDGLDLNPTKENDMNIQDALQVFGLSGDVTQDAAKQRYRELVSKYHPDRNPAGLTIMQAVNAARDALQNAFDNEWAVTAKADNNAEYGDELNAAINAIIDIDGIDIEVCGSWVWLSGDTKEHRAEIKAAGYKWAKKKVMWYFRPDNYRSRARGKFTIDEIRDMHGSSTVQRPTRPAIA